MNKPAILVLEDGSVFHGCSIGQDGQTVGEVVFNTSMTGYQEILTDPSYAEQIVTLTYPHIGNVGTTPEDEEAVKIWTKGLIIRELSKIASNWRSKMSLPDYLKQKNIVAISNIDTRRLTRLLRDKGAMRGCITTDINVDKALAAAKAFPDMNGADLAKVVSIQKPYIWTESSWSLQKGHQEIPKEKQRFHVVAYDYGVKLNILRLLADRGCKLTVVPAETPAKDVLAMKPDGIFLSNGPGDPAACTYAIEAIKEFLTTNVPIFGICLGHQLLALASGAKTVKMKFGHHGANHPVKDLRDNTVLITSQNHGFAVDESSLPDNLEITHRSLFDNTLQGIRRKDKPAFSFQGHPEASPGPRDVSMLFDEFITLMQ